MLGTNIAKAKEIKTITKVHKKFSFADIYLFPLNSSYSIVTLHGRKISGMAKYTDKKDVTCPYIRLEKA